MELVETLNRTMKLAMDEGLVNSYEEAESLFASFQLRIHVQPGFSKIPAVEAAILTLLNAAPKTFLGGVELVGSLQEKCTRAWLKGKTLGEAAQYFGVAIDVCKSTDIPTIHVGKGKAPCITFWLGINLQHDGFLLSPDIAMASSQASSIELGVAAAGAALNEAFQHAYRKAPLAGQREIFWSRPCCNSEPLHFDSCWLIGLGHLGQAFLWTLMLSDTDSFPRSIRLTDFDTVSWSSLSTCLLVGASDVGRLKVDAVAERLESLGIEVQRDGTRLNLATPDVVQSEQDLAVVAVDNIALRRSLDRLHASLVLEAGIGEGTEAFTRVQFHAFPGLRKARDIWVGDGERSSRTSNLSQPAYQTLLAKSGDECGTALVAGRSIATPFVGAFAGALLSILACHERNGTCSWNYDINGL